MFVCLYVPRQNQVLNHLYVTIITNAVLSIISTKMNICFVFQFDSVLTFL